MSHFIQWGRSSLVCSPCHLCLHLIYLAVYGDGHVLYSMSVYLSTRRRESEHWSELELHGVKWLLHLILYRNLRHSNYNTNSCVYIHIYHWTLNWILFPCLLLRLSLHSCKCTKHIFLENYYYHNHTSNNRIFFFVDLAK